MNLSAFVHSKHPVLRAAAFLNGIEIGNIEIKHGEKTPQDFTFDLPHGILSSDKSNTLEFYLDNLASAKSLGLSNDFRLRGLGFRSMYLK